MAINTPKPISRDERYLSKIGGNEEVIVPKPISREEKYMYRAAGYDDQPIPDYPISRKEKYWAKIIENGGGSGNGSTVTFDSGQKFISDNSSLKDYKIYGNGGEIHSTGVLPLTFTAKGCNAVDWTIYGNDDAGENLYGVNASVSISTVSAVCSGSEIAIESDGTNTIVSATAANWKNNLSVNLSAGSYGYKIERTGTTTGIISSIYDVNNTAIGSSQTSGTFTLPADTSVYIGFYIPANTIANGAIKLIITAGSTAPDHYIPYQQGVGERTENLFNGNFEQGLYSTSSGNPIDSPRYIRSDKQVISSGETYTFSFNCPKVGPAGSGKDVWVSFWAADNHYIKYQQETQYTEHMTFTTPGNAGYVALFVGAGANGEMTPTDISDVMLVKGNTAPTTYIPYGYEIPISVNNTLQTFYIGDSPLTAGQSISKTSTGQDIELFDGENTVSTTLYNKPTMEIETSYGVGVKDNNHYIIPFKVNTTIYNIQIGDSPLYDGEYLSYKEKKLYKYINSVLTPIDPPSPFPEISTTEGVNKIIIETSTQPDSIFITTQNPIKLVQPNIGTKTITQNGVYNASNDNLDGYSSVTVNTN